MGAQRPPWDPTRSLLFKSFVSLSFPAVLLLPRVKFLCFLFVFVFSCVCWPCLLLLLVQLKLFGFAYGRSLYLSCWIPVPSEFGHPPRTCKLQWRTEYSVGSQETLCHLLGRFLPPAVRNQEIPSCLSKPFLLPQHRSHHHRRPLLD